MLLLDTYTLIGVASEPSRLSQTAKALIQNPANRLFVSAVSALEIGTAVQKRRLQLQIDARTWFERALTVHAIEPIEISWQIAMAAVELPPYHADPADRIIIATAISRSLTLVTPDQKMRLYTVAKIAW